MKDAKIEIDHRKSGVEKIKCLISHFITSGILPSTGGSMRQGIRASAEGWMVVVGSGKRGGTHPKQDKQPRRWGSV